MTELVSMHTTKLPWQCPVLKVLSVSSSTLAFNGGAGDGNTGS